MTQTFLLDQCQPQWYLQNPDEAGQAILLCDYTPERKRWGPTNCLLQGVFDHGWYEFQLKCWWLCFGFCKIQVPDPTAKGSLMAPAGSYIML